MIVIAASTNSNESIVPILVLIFVVAWLVSLKKNKKPKGKWFFVPEKKGGCMILLIPLAGALVYSILNLSLVIFS